MSPNTRHEILDFLKVIAWFLVLLFGMRTFVVEGFEIHGSSMEPTLEDNERLFVLKFTYRFDDVERGDVIVFRYPEDTSRRFIKRVIGLPGDGVAIQNGRVLVNGGAIEEPYVDREYIRRHENVTATIVPDDCYYVLGDHRNVSSDSRSGWVVPESYIVGKAALRFWPPMRFGKF